MSKNSEEQIISFYSLYVFWQNEIPADGMNIAHDHDANHKYIIM